MPRLGKVIRETFYFGFQPLFMLTVFAAWWYLPTTADAPLETAVVLLLVANVAVYMLEHTLPDRGDWVTSSADRKVDAFYVAARVFVFGPVLQLAMVLTIEPIVHTLNAPTIWPTTWPTLSRIALALVVAELVAFIVHVSMHRLPRLWRYHATHHAQTKLSSARWAANHPVEIAVVQLPIFFLVTALGPELVDIAGAIIIGRVTVIVAHSNLQLSSAPLGWLLTTPETHRRHHAVGADSPANYADVLLIFDRFFGTFSATRSTRVGLEAGREIALRDQLRLRGIDSAATSEQIIDLRESVQDRHRSIISEPSG